MPLYEFKCKTCGNHFDAFRPMSESALPLPCRCGASAERVLSAAAVRGDFQGYSCPVTGKWVEGRKAHEENLKRTGCHVLEKGEKEDAVRRRKASDAVLENAVANTAARLVEAMPAEKQRKLGEELSATSVKYERG